MVNEVHELDDFTFTYIMTALWSTNDWRGEADGEPLSKNHDVHDLAPETLRAMVADCNRFREEAGDMLEEHPDPEMGAHDFWLTRNGHGAGFWDGDWPEHGDALTAMVGWGTDFPEMTLYIGDDGLIYQMEG